MAVGKKVQRLLKLSTNNYFLFFLFSVAVGKSLVKLMLEADEVSSDEN